jgi:hypothetical protein
MWHVWGRGEAYTGFGCGNLRERGRLGDEGVDGRIILKWMLKAVGWSGMDLNDLAQDKDRWRAVVNAVMNFWYFKMRGNS